MENKDKNIYKNIFKNFINTQDKACCLFLYQPNNSCFSYPDEVKLKSIFTAEEETNRQILASMLFQNFFHTPLQFINPKYVIPGYINSSFSALFTGLMSNLLKGQNIEPKYNIFLDSTQFYLDGDYILDLENKKLAPGIYFVHLGGHSRILIVPTPEEDFKKPTIIEGYITHANGISIELDPKTKEYIDKKKKPIDTNTFLHTSNFLFFDKEDDFKKLNNIDQQDILIQRSDSCLCSGLAALTGIALSLNGRNSLYTFLYLLNHGHIRNMEDFFKHISFMFTNIDKAFQSYNGYMFLNNELAAYEFYYNLSIFIAQVFFSVDFDYISNNLKQDNNFLTLKPLEINKILKNESIAIYKNKINDFLNKKEEKEETILELFTKKVIGFIEQNKNLITKGVGKDYITYLLNHKFQAYSNNDLKSLFSIFAIKNNAENIKPKNPIQGDEIQLMANFTELREFFKFKDYENTDLNDFINEKINPKEFKKKITNKIYSIIDYNLEENVNIFPHDFKNYLIDLKNHIKTKNNSILLLPTIKDELNKLKSTNKKFEQISSIKNFELQENELMLNQIKTKSKEQESIIISLNKKLSDLKLMEELNETELKNLKQTNLEAKNKLSTLEQTKLDLEKTLINQNKELEQNKLELEKKNKKLPELELELQKIKSSSEVTLNELSNLKKLNGNLMTARSNIESDNKKLTETKLNIEKELNQKIQELNNLKSNIQKLELDNKNLNEAKLNIEKELNQKIQELTNLTDNNKKLTENFNNLQQDYQNKNENFKLISAVAILSIIMNVILYLIKLQSSTAPKTKLIFPTK